MFGGTLVYEERDKDGNIVKQVYENNGGTSLGPTKKERVIFDIEKYIILSVFSASAFCFGMAIYSLCT
jgi:hypothetical protein